MKVLFVFGTRPEAIKLIPVIKKMDNFHSQIEYRICITSQHREMLWQILNFFKIHPDYDLKIMKQNQSLFDITSQGLKKIEKVYEEYKPDMVIVQGDASSAFIGALGGFYKKVKVAHIEAGLRSYDRYAPFPEEMNRILVSHLSNFYFAPTEQARLNLLNEGIKEKIFIVGNTVIDALLLTLSIIENDDKLREEISGYFKKVIPDIFERNDKNLKLILVTAHRRESFGEPFEEICNALIDIVKNNKYARIIYPVHLNPNVSGPVFKFLKNIPNIHLITPLDYPYLVWLMHKACFVLTDSGGIQEEAPSLGKPVLVMREVTERVEGISAGTAKLVGARRENIARESLDLIENVDNYNNMSKAISPYGDGKSAEKIVRILMEENNLVRI